MIPHGQLQSALAATIDPKPLPSLLSILQNGPLKICLIGSGNWGTAVGKILALNAASNHLFQTEVAMWVHEEQIHGQNLSEIINYRHENVKYLPNVILPNNLVAVPNLADALRGATLLVFVVPHQFVRKVCSAIAEQDYVRHARAISLIKGIEYDQGPATFSALIAHRLQISCSVLCGANVAKDVASDQFCEATIGYISKEDALIWQLAFHRPNFQVHAIPDRAGVEICGAAKNVVALAAGFCQGLNYGSNTSAAIMRIGFVETKNFATIFFHNILNETFFESAGLADLITTCTQGRNARCAAIFAKSNGSISWKEIETAELNGQLLQGPHTSQVIHQVLEEAGLLKHFPLFDVVYRIAFEGCSPCELLKIFERSTPSLVMEATDCTVTTLPAALKHLKDRPVGLF